MAAYLRLVKTIPDVRKDDLVMFNQDHVFVVDSVDYIKGMITFLGNSLPSFTLRISQINWQVAKVIGNIGIETI